MHGVKRPSSGGSAWRRSNLTSLWRFRRLIYEARERVEAGPGARLARIRLCRDDYQLPPLGHAPLPGFEQVRVTAPVAGFLAIVNVVPDFDVATIP